jgi:hypothetical protein
MYVAAPVALETFLSRYIASLLEPPPSLAERPGRVDPPATTRPAQDLTAALDSLSAADEPITLTTDRHAYEDAMKATRPYEETATAPRQDAPPPFRYEDSTPAQFEEPLWPRYDERAPETVVSRQDPSSPRYESSASSYFAPEPPKTSYAAPEAKPSHGAEPVKSHVAAQPPTTTHAAPDTAKTAPRDLTDLLGPDPLPGAPPAGTAVKPLFDADEPFNATATAQAGPSRRSFGRIAAIAAAVIVLGVAGVVSMKFFGGGKAPVPAMGSLAVQSNPSGVPVFVDGIEQGKTPARVSLLPGSHILELRGQGVPRVIPVTVTAGAEVSQYLEFAEAPVTGQLAVQSEPAGAKVLVDGTDRGIAPVTIADLAPGEHRVELQADGITAKHTVTVQAGGTASLVVPIGAAAAGGPVSGWVAVNAPFSLEIREQGRLLGSSDADRVMMAAGKHQLEFVNEALNYRSTRVVLVAPGKVASVSLELPQGVVNLNASPWAEVWIDGKRVGETPIGNLSVSIGPHEIVFKHPQLGEKRQAISVTLGTPARLSVDMK